MELTRKKCSFAMARDDSVSDAGISVLHFCEGPLVLLPHGQCQGLKVCCCAKLICDYVEECFKNLDSINKNRMPRCRSEEFE